MSVHQKRGAERSDVLVDFIRGRLHLEHDLLVKYGEQDRQHDQNGSDD